MHDSAKELEYALFSFTVLDLSLVHLNIQQMKFIPNGAEEKRHCFCRLQQDKYKGN